jgi:hypothetical protein
VKRRNADKSGLTLTQHIEALSREHGYNNYAHLRASMHTTAP